MKAVPPAATPHGRLPNLAISGANAYYTALMISGNGNTCQRKARWRGHSGNCAYNTRESCPPRHSTDENRQRMPRVLLSPPGYDPGTLRFKVR